MKLAEYNFKIIYKKGSINTNAGTLSRMDEEVNKNEVNQEDFIESLLSIVEEREKLDKDNMIHILLKDEIYQ